MNLNPLSLEDSSVHYYIPQAAQPREYLYVPYSVGSFACKPAYRVDRHNYNSFLLILMTSGTLRYTSLNSRGGVHPGEALLLDCHLPHSYQADGPCSFLFLHFGGGQSKALCAALEATSGNVLRLPSGSCIQGNIAAILQSMAQCGHVEPPRASHLIYQMLMELLSSSPVPHEGTTGDPFIDQALDYIHQHLAERITVRSMAEHTGYSESYFARKFIRCTGVTPYQFVLRCRLERAQQLLQTTALTVQEIAAQTGFNSVANFSYTFRKEYGLAPHEYRERPV